MQDAATDGPLRLVPFGFWLPLSGRSLQQRSEVEGCAAGGSATGHPAERPADRRLADPEHSLASPAAAPASDCGRPPSLATLQQAIGEQLAALGHAGAEPLRWAITGTDPQRGMRLEGIGLSNAAGRGDPRGAAIAPASGGQTQPTASAPIRQT